MAAAMSHSRSLKTDKNHDKSSQFTSLDKYRQTENTCHELNQQKFEYLQTALQQFYLNRNITLKNLKSDTIQNVLKSLAENGIEMVECNMDQNTASIKPNNCIHTENVIERLSELCDVTVEPSDKWLCIANLQSNYTNQKLKQLVSSYGGVSRCFMYCSSHTEESLGYGFVEFDCDVEQIQQKLDWTYIDNHPVHCEVMAVTSYDKLLSRCLLIDNLPKDFTDVMALRDIFSKLHSPLYCQIVMKGSEPLGFGIIEYKTHNEAQKSKTKLENYKIHNQPIRITYCIPGKSGIYMCTKIITKYACSGNNTKKGLLPDPIFPNDNVMKTPLVKQLCQQHPDLMTCFKQALDQLQQSYVSQVTGPSKPGLLGPAPSASLNPLINPNMQLGLMVLLALQIQSRSQNKIIGPLDLFGLVMNQQNKQDSKSSILGSPLAAQAGVILKNLTSQMSTGTPLIPNIPTSNNRQHNNQSNSALHQSMAWNLKNINMNLLINLGQLASSLQSKSKSALGTLLPETSGILGNLQETSSILGKFPDTSSIHGGLQKTSSILGSLPETPGVIAEAPSILGSAPKFPRQNGSMFGNVPQPLMSKPNLVKANDKPKSLLDLNFEQPVYSSLPNNSISAIKENIPNNRSTDYQNRNMSKNRSQEINEQYTTSSDVTGNQYWRNPVNIDENYTTNVNRTGLLSSRNDYPDQYNHSTSHIKPLMSVPCQKSHRNMSQSYQSSDVYATENRNSNASYGQQSVNRARHAGSVNQNSQNCLEILQRNSQNCPELIQRNSQNCPELIPRNSQNCPELIPRNSRNCPEPITRNSLLGEPNEDVLSMQQNYNLQNDVELMPPPLIPEGVNSKMNNQVSGKYSQLIDQAIMYHETDSSISPLLSTRTQMYHDEEPLYQSFQYKRSRSQTSSLSDYSDSFTDTSSVYENSYRSNDSLFSDGSRLTPVSLRDDGLLKTPTGQKRSYSHLLPPPEPSPEGDFIGQHSQGIGGHYADSYRKRVKLDREDLKLRY